MDIPWTTIDTRGTVRVGDGTVLLAIMIYIGGSFIRNRIAAAAVRLGYT